MPSLLKARSGRPSAMEMKAQLDSLRKPQSRQIEAIFDKYLQICHSMNPRLTSIEVVENVNWKALIMSLPTPSQVLGCGIRKILLMEQDCVYEGIYRFHVQRLDGSMVSFDFRHAYDDPYHWYKDKSFKHDVDTALRAGVLSQLIQFKEMLSKDGQVELMSNISGVALSWERAVVQHFPVPLQVLIEAFLNENQLALESIKLDYCEENAYRIKDPELLDKWRVYHRSQANYRVISVEEAMDQDHL